MVIAILIISIYLICKFSSFRRGHGYGRIFKAELKKLKELSFNDK